MIVTVQCFCTAIAFVCLFLLHWHQICYATNVGLCVLILTNVILESIIDYCYHDQSSHCELGDAGELMNPAMGKAESMNVY